MWITKIQIENFRSIKDTLYLYPVQGGPTVLVGGNSNGKSNILRAINLFFNESVEPHTKYDSRIDAHQGEKSATRINVVFKFDPEKDKFVTSFLDDSYAGQFKDYEVPVTYNVYQNGNANYTFIGERGRKKQFPELIDKIKEYVSCIYIPSNKDHRNIINREMIRKIVAATFQGYGRGINSARKVKDQKEKFKNLSSDMQGMLNESAEYVTELMQGASQRVETFKFMLPYGSLDEFLGELDFQIKEKDLADTVRLDSVGSGIQSFTVITMLKLLHEIRPKSTPKKSAYIWLIEEPETFMHHDLQRKTKEKLFEFSKDGHIFATTHSSIFVDKRNYRNTYSITHSGQTKAAVVNKGTLHDVLVGNLGIRFTDINVFSRYNVLVEGESDKSIMEAANAAYAVLDPNDVQFIDCGSASAEVHFYEMFNGFNDYADFVAIFDRDEAGMAARQKLLESGRDRSRLLLLEKQGHYENASIEDLLSKTSWSEMIKDLSESGLIEITTKKDMITKYDFDHRDRIKVKKRASAFIIDRIKSKPEDCLGYKKLLLDVKAALGVP